MHSGFALMGDTRLGALVSLRSGPLLFWAQRR
jgi:hypothetical protein